MGNESDSEGQTRSQDDMRISKTSTDPIIMAGPDTAAMVANVPYIASMNVNKSVGVHIGTKVVSITQNVQNTEGVRDMPFLRYLLSVMKDTTRAERAATIGVVVGLVVCIAITTYVVLTLQHSKADNVDVAPHEWNITRQMWLARPVNHSNSTLMFSPVDLVVIQHSVSSECYTFAACASEMRNLQSYFIDVLHYDDIAYNFQVGNDGRVYAGRGWGVLGAHTFGYNKCSLGIGFIGDYREDYNLRTKVSEKQIQSTQMLLEDGVKMGFLLPNYKVVGGLDLRASASPGSNLYNEIRKWPHYDHRHIYKNKTCEQMHVMINDKNTS